VAPVDWTALDRAARHRYGLITDAALAEHASPKQQRRLVAGGELVRVHPGLLRVAGAPVTERQRTLAAVAAAGPDAAASHRSAAKLLGLIDDWPANPEVTIPQRRLPRLLGVDVHRSSALVPEWITAIGFIATTNPLLTLVMLGAVAGRTVVASAVERAVVARLITIQGLTEFLDIVGRSGRNGAGVLREVLALRALGDERSDSVLEEMAASLLRRFQLPPAEYHFVIRGAGGQLIAEVDFAYPMWMLAIEVDGWAVHGSPRAMRRDYERQGNIEDLGWRVLRFTWYDVVRRPDYVARRIRTALCACGAL
jgi:very-short-patch-repair endonuclease